MCYLQTYTIIGNLDLNWGNSLATYYSIQNSLSGNFIKLVSIDCLSLIDIPSVYVTPIINIVMPFLIFLPFSVLFAFYKFIKKRTSFIFLKNLFLTLCVATFTCISNILYSLTDLMNCREIFPGKYYLNSYLSENCDDSRYKLWLDIFVIPAFTIYGLVLPISTFFYMFIHRKGLYRQKNTIIGFLINGFSRSKYYWFIILYINNCFNNFNKKFREILLFARKIMIVFLVSSLSIQVEAKASLILLVMCLAVFVDIKNLPFHTKNLNSLEINSCFTIISTILIAVSSYKINNDIFSVFAILANFILNFQFLFVVIKKVVILKIGKFLKEKQSKGTWKNTFFLSLSKIKLKK